MPEPAPSPLARLVLFMICLSIAGSILAGAHYYAIDLPEQKALSEQTPANANSNTGEKCNTCRSQCGYLSYNEVYQCLAICENICN